jgi:hypothetical protein
MKIKSKDWNPFIHTGYQLLEALVIESIHKDLKKLRKLRNTAKNNSDGIYNHITSSPLPKSNILPQ